MGPEGQQCQGEGQVTHTGVRLEQSHQGDQDIGEEHRMVTVQWGREGNSQQSSYMVYVCSYLNLTERGST